ncbi:hypothetical protein PHMEG_00014995 [Phytophthora megakarya]|uniref:Uncharacterized protein n=1 Tax=Phytophthora megakarya TaxID=4795 RepID=A0A225W2F2_9STRA|nr:hypothetical protein PHMEG_00014995 [Phytophthora megakarya]
MVERQLIKAQDRNAVRLQEQKVASYDDGDSVWVFQHFRAKRGEKRTKKLAFSWIWTSVMWSVSPLEVMRLLLRGVSSPILHIVAKRVENLLVEYLALTPTSETFWLSRSVLSPVYDALIMAFENAERKKKSLPELRRSERLEDANAVVDEDELLF